MTKTKITKGKKPKSLQAMTPAQRSAYNKSNRLVLARGRFLPLRNRVSKNMGKRLTHVSIMNPNRLGWHNTYGRVGDWTINPGDPMSSAVLIFSSENAYRMRQLGLVNTSKINDKYTLLSNRRPDSISGRLYEPQKELLIMEVMQRAKYALKRKRMALTR